MREDMGSNDQLELGPGSLHNRKNCSLITHTTNKKVDEEKYILVCKH